MVCKPPGRAACGSASISSISLDTVASICCSMNLAVDQKITPNSSKKLTPVRAAYIRVSRKLDVRNSLGRCTETIACAAYGMNQWTGALLIDLSAQPADVRLDYVGVWVEVKVPYVLQQHRASHDLIDVLHQVFKQ